MQRRQTKLTLPTTHRRYNGCRGPLLLGGTPPDPELTAGLTRLAELTAYLALSVWLASLALLALLLSPRRRHALPMGEDGVPCSAADANAGLALLPG